MHKGFSRRFVATTALTAGALVMGVAFASWTATGSGSGTAKAVTATASAVTTDPSGATADLYPGKTGGTLYFKVDNPNPYAVQFTSASLGSITSSDPANCPATSANISVESSVTGLAINVPANTTTPVSRSISGVVGMPASAADGCQGVTFTIAITLSGTQQ